ncbi:MAG: hypothetical protein Q4G16_04245 [Cruoricaptor ignavus]|nr:hypothetical protein [Cruoricaptor ignavus]
MKKDLSILSNEELIKEFKNRRFFLGFFLGIILTMAVISIINLINKDVKTTTYLPLIFLPIALMFWNNFKEVKKEMISRKLK